METFDVRFEFPPDERLVCVELSGSFSLAALERARSLLALHPQFDPSYRRCYDLRRLTGIPELPRSMNSFLREFMAFDPVVAKRALVVNAADLANLATYAELANPDLVRLFIDRTAALKWILAP